MKKRLCKQFDRDLKYAKEAMVLFGLEFAKDGIEQAKIHREEIQRFIDGIKYQLKAKDFVWDAVGNNVIRYQDGNLLRFFTENDVRNKIKITRRLIKIKSSVNLDATRNVELPENLYITGSMDLSRSAVDSLPEFMDVSQELTLNDKITKLPDVLRVGGDIRIPSSCRPIVWSQAAMLKDKGMIKGDLKSIE